MKTRVHAIAGAIGFLMILTFWSSTIISEVFGSHETIAMVKGMILKGMFVLIPAMAIVGASGGMSLGAGRSDPLVLAKKKRMPIIGGANGLLVLVPMAIILEARASAGNFDTLFYLLQGGVELIAGGAVNLTLMGKNMRDGIRLSGKGGKPADLAKLTGRETIAAGTMAFHMTKPKGFDHTPGQWVRLTLPTTVENGGKGPSRVLSIVSAPDEPHLTVATRLSDSAFKRGLKDLPDGTDLRVAGPNGSFTLHEDPQRPPAVFIAGGIGITPFMSMIRHAVRSASAPPKITLFYSNRDLETAGFLNELEEIAKGNPNFELVATMTALQGDDAGWSGETGGVIDQKMLARHVTDLKAPIYYCVGPAGMVTSTQAMLSAAGGIAGENVVCEQFTGY